MKLISLNTWGGKIFDPLINFVKEESKNTDVFCFQEILTSKEHETVRDGLRIHLFDDLSEVLKDHQGFFDGVSKGANFDHLIDYDLVLGLAIFIKKDVVIKNHGDVMIGGERFQKLVADLSNVPRNLQFVQLEGEKPISIFNFHGIWMPVNKLDSPDRLEQSNKVLEFLDQFGGAKILCGDFNLMPNTKSIAMIEQRGFRNLVKDFDIQDTRGPINKKKYGGVSLQSYADFMFTSKEVKIVDFQVPQVAVSDHLPLILEFEL